MLFLLFQFYDNAFAQYNGTYYYKRDFTQPKYTRTDTNIDFNWSDGGPGSVGDDNYSIIWTRTFNFKAGTYTFYSLVDDGIN